MMRISIVSLSSFRGISSTVRRCIEKETGVEYAAKIIDVSSSPELRACTLEEVRILRALLGYSYISEYS